MTRLLVRVHTRLLALGSRCRDCGQTTAEYALVLLGAAAIALLVVAWAADTSPVGGHRAVREFPSSSGSGLNGLRPPGRLAKVSNNSSQP